VIWEIEIDPEARRDLDRLSKSDRERILAFLYGRVAQHPNPTDLATRLVGSKEGLSRFRVGDHRIVVKFFKSRLVVLVIEIGHRRDVYR
jgi:mRNA interferase RelE/StbE